MKIGKMLLLSAVLSFVFIGNAYSQVNISDANYGFKFNPGSDWKKTKTEETSKSDAISYSFEKKDGSIVISLLAFKVESVKSLDDLIYTLEKDMTLNIPKKDGDYKSFSNANYDGRSAVYKDSEYGEKIYYYRTVNQEGQNYTYMLRFITAAVNYPAAEKEFDKIAKSFTIND